MKSAIFKPMPSASVKIAASANPGSLRNFRMAKTASRKRSSSVSRRSDRGSLPDLSGSTELKAGTPRGFLMRQPLTFQVSGEVLQMKPQFGL